MVIQICGFKVDLCMCYHSGYLRCDFNILNLFNATSVYFVKIGQLICSSEDHPMGECNPLEQNVSITLMFNEHN